MIRAFVYTFAFFTVSALFLILGSWLLLAPRSWAMAGLSAHGRSCVWLLEKIAGTRLEVRGHENLPRGAVLVASKHQSAWDTFALVPLLRDPAIVMKRELMWIPLYGWFSAKFGMIFVRRSAGPAALRRMARDAAMRAGEGREIVIFPEGTRREPGADPAYRPGVHYLYAQLGLPCCPVALNSGLYWPRRSLARYPGTIIVEFLKPIPPGLPRKVFAKKLQSAIETASDALIKEAARSANPPPIPESARRRLGL
ncbi:MAG TPA: 1-acyl-sn-glycerol-3-phosphate acyltransferase [Rhizobiales bacterium]|nr:1-acyl-sn-glycerol-3-phosphate acyltransferase [bacterium BMS3Bbin10]HDO51462.1 1-acyl-sn-glycerol-3-phosphate acyltransferase [Hyphomicrobiales bacterium]